MDLVGNQLHLWRRTPTSRKRHVPSARSCFAALALATTFGFGGDALPGRGRGYPGCPDRLPAGEQQQPPAVHPAPRSAAAARRWQGSRRDPGLPRGAASGDVPINFDVERSLLTRELERANEFGKLSENYETTLEVLRPLKERYQLMHL